MKKKICVILTMVLILGAFAGCGGGGGDKVVVASKQYTENILLGEIYAQLIENLTDVPVERKLNLGGTLVCLTAMQNGEVDIYFEFAGTAYNEILKLGGDGTVDSDEIYRKTVEGLSEEYGIKMFDSIGINNKYALALKPEKAEELGIRTMSDLAAVPGLRFGCGHTFYDRLLDGYTTMMEVYEMDFASVQRLDAALLYEAAEQGSLDVIVVFTTDSLLNKFDLFILEDDQQMFPDYHGSPIIPYSTLEKFPELEEVLNLLSGYLNDEWMQNLNAEVDLNNKTVAQVAREFLEGEGLI